MGNAAGSFIWYELMTSDAAGAAAFYGPVVGWKIAAHSDPAAGGVDYRMIVRDDGGMAGGVLTLPPEMLAGGAQPCWMPYFHAPDVDAQVAAIEAQGGKVQMPATDLPVGRIAMVADPQGVPIYLMNPTPPAGSPEASSDVFDEAAAQRVRWNELSSPDLDASLKFYGEQFGFTFDERMPMGPMGDYCFIGHHGRTLGGIMQRQDPQQPAAWLLYFGVPSIAEAKRTVEAQGGQIVMGPMEVPGGEWVVVGIDPQGAMFGLVGAQGA
ncbi:putative enzyme related to lactoylglutathione lyase [Novosphingobium chloroacetimidivorans]|uniref:Putative enzyme related to lactoylglutathione lyase n=1 Tax=Novosphingobium chloroacetimidivorans TaxID=1428314 RepID=A0A7W7KBK3_9SPHN|nr:VOC family protein [Novosphingobium chloroacetimidivorans]MBB4859038.1 putative enzyme related to lactoylglutathione lyase [Novosphingobium chloroacetimidivorans]